MKRYAYLDIEATHTNWNDAEIIEVGLIVKDEDGDVLDHFESLIRPQNLIDEGITELTGISQNMVDNAPEFYKVAPKLYEKLQDTIIVAHKASFDYEILKKSFTPLGFELRNKTVCTLEMSQRLVPDLYSYSLLSLCHLFGIKQTRSHRAMDDAISLSELHLSLVLLDCENRDIETYFPHHQKLIDSTKANPGIIIIRDGRKSEIFKTENIKRKLRELLKVSPSNRKRLVHHTTIKTIPSASLIKAGLNYSNAKKAKYPFCIYYFKSKAGRIILKYGETKNYKNIVYYTHSETEARKALKSLIPSSAKSRLVYRDPNDKASDALELNSQIERKIRNLNLLHKNYLVGSVAKHEGKYQYIVIKSSQLYANFSSPMRIESPSQINFSKLRFKSITPRVFMSLNHSLKWIRQQRQKTDYVIELKEKCFSKSSPRKS